MQHFVTTLNQGSDLYSAFPDEVNGVGGIAKHEDPFTTPAFSCSHHCVEVMYSLLIHSVQQLEWVYKRKTGITVGRFCLLVHACFPSDLNLIYPKCSTTSGFYVAALNRPNP